MRKGITVSSVLLCGVLAAACNDTPMEVNQLEVSDPDLAVRSGEQMVGIRLTNPSSSTYSLRVGQTKQMTGQLRYSRGGTLPSAPYASWMSTDNCVATVSSAYPSWGKVKGVQAGTAKIIVSAWGKADTVTVRVTGSGNLDPKCEEKQWSWDRSDESFTEEPADSYRVKAGEKLRKLVLFAPEDPISRGSSEELTAELWYSGGGKLDGSNWVSWATTDGSIATVDRGVVRARKPGKVKIITRLGSNLADTVPVIVK